MSKLLNFLLIMVFILIIAIALVSYKEQMKVTNNSLKVSNCTVYVQNVSDNLVGYYYDSECLSEVN